MNRINLTLAVVAVILALLLARNDRSEAPAPAAITPTSAEAVERIELYLGNAGKPGIVLQRQAGAWRILQPVQVAADEFAVGKLLALLAATSRGQRDPDSMDLARLKLAPPLWRARYDDVELRIGAIESLREQRYVQSDSGLHLVDDFNPAPFDGNYADLVSRQLLPGAQRLEQIRWPDTRVSQAGELSPALRQNWLQASAQWTARPLSADFKAVTSRVRVSTPERSFEFLIAGREPRLKLIRPDIDVLYNLPGSAAAELLPP